MRSLHGGRGHFNLFDQFALVGIHRIEAKYHVMFARVGGRIAQGTQRVHGGQCLLATPLQTAIHALRLINNHNRSGFFDQINWLFTTGFLAVLVEVIDVLFVNGPDCDHHDLNIGTGCKIANLTQFGRVVQKEVKRHPRVQTPEVLFGHLQGFIDPFLDGHRRHHNDKLAKTIAFVQLKHGAQIHVGFARTGLHFYGEVARLQSGSRCQTVTQLHLVQISQQLVIHQAQAIAHAQVRFGHAQAHLGGIGVQGHGKFGAANLLTAKKVTHGLYGLQLVVQIRFKVEFHGLVSMDVIAKYQGIANVDYI